MYTAVHSDYSLDRLYGDCTEILVALLDFIEKYVIVYSYINNSSADKGGDTADKQHLAQVVNKSLSVAEIIVQVCISITYSYSTGY